MISRTYRDDEDPVTCSLRGLKAEGENNKESAFKLQIAVVAGFS